MLSGLTHAYLLRRIISQKPVRAGGTDNAWLFDLVERSLRDSRASKASTLGVPRPVSVS